MANAGGGAAGEGEWLKVAQLRALVQEDHRAKVSPGPTRFPSPRLASSSCSRRAPVRTSVRRFDLCRLRTHQLSLFVLAYGKEIFELASGVKPKYAPSRPVADPELIQEELLS
jgi:hypothetical protein